MKIAIEGCMHGDLDNVYATLLHLQQVEKTKIDLLICCGDFQVSPTSISCWVLFFIYVISFSYNYYMYERVTVNL